VNAVLVFMMNMAIRHAAHDIQKLVDAAGDKVQSELTSAHRAVLAGPTVFCFAHNRDEPAPTTIEATLAFLHRGRKCS
jgi:hypothetical protein